MSQTDPYLARHSFVDPARGRVTLIRLVVCFLIIEVVWLFCGPIIVPWSFETEGSAWRTMAVHLAFLSITLPTFLMAQMVQGRSPITMFGPIATFVADFRSTVVAMLVLYVALHLIPGTDTSGLERNLDGLSWLLLLPFAAVAVLIQTSAEEILYRGFLQQSLGALSDRPAVWMVLPSILFGLSHYNPNIPVEATTLHCIWAIFFGLAAADLTARTGTLGAAIGLHFTYNLPLIILYAEPGLMSGFGLFVQTVSWADSDPTLLSFVFDLFYLWMVWMACRIGIRC